MADQTNYDRLVGAVQTAKDFAAEELGPESDSWLAKLLTPHPERRQPATLTEEQARRLVQEQMQSGTKWPAANFSLPGQSWTQPLADAMETAVRRSPWVQAAEQAGPMLDKGRALWDEYAPSAEETLAKVLLMQPEPRQSQPQLTEEQVQRLIQQRAQADALRRGSGN